MKTLKYYGSYSNAPEGTVEYTRWDDYDRKDIETERVYREVGEIATEVPAGDYTPGYVRVTTTIYVDTETGILVADIPQYENWRASK